MTHRKERGLNELYSDDPERADAVVWGRSPHAVSRRGFLQRGGLLTLSGAIGAAIPYARFLPAGLIPAAFADGTADTPIPGKDALIVLNDRPLNAETPAHLLDDSVTPASKMFVRNNGVPPVTEGIDPNAWQLGIGGEACLNPTSFSIADLRRSFTAHTYQLQIECGGNGRREFYPAAKGNQWTTGAVSCAEWTGVRLRDVLNACGIADNAVYVAYTAADTHLSGDPQQTVISRGVPIAKALEDETLIAWAMNGEPIPALHGYPLRLVAGGWPGSVSGKWLRQILVRDRVHDGAKMTGQSYRVPCRPVAPGSTVPDEDMCIIESMPVKSLVTYPRSGIETPAGRELAIRGQAWAGDRSVTEVHVSIDFGATWQRAAVEPPANRLAWQRWRATIRLPVPGYYEVWARATDNQGVSQPMVVPGWNPRGYLNNATHRIAVQAT